MAWLHSTSMYIHVSCCMASLHSYVYTCILLHISSSPLYTSHCLCLPSSPPPPPLYLKGCQIYLTREIQQDLYVVGAIGMAFATSEVRTQHTHTHTHLDIPAAVDEHLLMKLCICVACMYVYIYLLPSTITSEIGTTSLQWTLCPLFGGSTVHATSLPAVSNLSLSLPLSPSLLPYSLLCRTLRGCNL